MTYFLICQDVLIRLLGIKKIISKLKLLICFLKNPHLKICLLILERQRKTEGEGEGEWGEEGKEKREETLIGFSPMCPDRGSNL